jgi:hypothetical protein
MKQGALIFDERSDRYDIRFDLADYYGGLHCGETFDVMVGGRWKPTRIEYGDNTSYACYVSSSPLLKRSQYVQLPAKYGISLKKGQKNKRALRPSGKTENRGCFHTSPVSFADCSIFSAPSIAPSMTGK